MSDTLAEGHPLRVFSDELALTREAATRIRHREKRLRALAELDRIGAGVQELTTVFAKLDAATVDLRRMRERIALEGL